MRSMIYIFGSVSSDRYLRIVIDHAIVAELVQLRLKDIDNGMAFDAAFDKATATMTENVRVAIAPLFNKQNINAAEALTHGRSTWIQGDDEMVFGYGVSKDYAMQAYFEATLAQNGDDMDSWEGEDESGCPNPLLG